MESIDDCQRKCGEMEIPYPFGMKEGCYLDKTFEVKCKESTGSASLASLDWELKNISLSNHTLQRKDYKVQTFKDYNPGRNLSYSLDLLLKGNHYWISHSNNMFVVKGCDLLAYLYDDEVTLGVCAAICNKGYHLPQRPSTCQGLNCCQMDFLKDIRNCKLDIFGLSNNFTDDCGFFTFIDVDYLSFHHDLSACNKSYTVPVVYEWAVGNTSCEQENLCRQNSRCINYSTHYGYICICKKGYKGNPYLPQGCQDIDECKESKQNRCTKNNRCVNTEGSYYCLPNRGHPLELAIPLGIGLAVGLLVLVATGLWTWQKIKMIDHEKMKQRFFKRNGGLLLQQQVSSSRESLLHELTLYKIEELEKATDKFSGSRILGKGGAGTVYKGMLSDGRIVAVKKANITNDSQIGQFVNELYILSQISHRHIVKLFGCCLESEVPLLVYEYVSNGTLSHHIHDEPDIDRLSWENRLRIAAEVAGALAYLHSYASTAIFHRDIKSSNILLNENYKAVISDFGISRSVSLDRTHLTTCVGGTFGYLDPEYFQSGQLNDRSDVYAFGVVLAEILTGQKPVSSAKDELGLAIRFRSAVKQDCLFEILEQVVAEEGQKKEILAVANLAKRCLTLNARKRPSMKEVAAQLDQLRKTKELQKHQESFHDDHCSKSERLYSSGNESETWDGKSLSE